MTILDQITRLQDFFRHTLWEVEATGVSRFFYQGCRLLILAVRGLIRNRSWLQATTLAYATMLALIPLMALLFAVLKGLGLQRLLATHIMDRLAPGAHDFAIQVLAYIEGTQVTSLGVFGVVFLLGALVILMSNVERAFNQTWRIPRNRSWRRQLSDYLSIFLLFPILMAVAISLSSGILSQPDIRRFLSGILPTAFYSYTSDLASLGLLWVAFTFIYGVMPNTKVRFSSALVGGIVGGSLWQLAHYLFSWFQGAATYYNAIYGALYHLLFLVLWMFWSWLVVLFGTEITYAHQNLARLTSKWRSPTRSGEPVDEYLALAALAAISRPYQQRQPFLTSEDLGGILASEDNLVSKVIQTLKECHLILEMAGTEPQQSPRLLPAIPLDQMKVKEVLDCLRQKRGAALADTLSRDFGLGALFRNLLAQPVPPPWDDMTMQELVQTTSPKS